MGILDQVARGTGYVLNPFSAVSDAGNYVANQDRNSGNSMLSRFQSQPKRIASEIGSANFDGMSSISEGQAKMLANFDDRQMEQYQQAISDKVTNEVRAGRMSPQEAQARVAQASFSLNTDGLTNSGQLQQGAMTAADLPDATSQLGDYNGLGMDNAYWSQLRNAAQAQEGITQDVGDTQISREFDRTARYRLPLENYRMDRDFAYGQKAEQNTSKRQRANDLMGTYAQTAQALITSGL
jgi:hypothetical protein